MNDPVTPVPAATILLIRDGSDGVETFMVVRHHEIDFASGALVFPGGKVDEQDQDDALDARCDGADSDPVTRHIQIAAIREAFEECGVLLAREPGSESLVSGARLRELDQYRDQIHGGTLTLLEFLTTHDLRLACDALVPFAHWITPEMMPKRFDTYFFLAAAPDDHVAEHDGHESVDSVWITSQQAMDDAKSGKHTVIFPTLMNVEKLGRATDVSDALQRARDDTVVTVLPRTERREDGAYLCIPKEAGYSVTEQKMPPRGAA